MSHEFYDNPLIARYASRQMSATIRGPIRLVKRRRQKSTHSVSEWMRPHLPGCGPSEHASLAGGWPAAQGAAEPRKLPGLAATRWQHGAHCGRQMTRARA